MSRNRRIFISAPRDIHLDPSRIKIKQAIVDHIEYKGYEPQVLPLRAETACRLAEVGPLRMPKGHVRVGAFCSARTIPLRESQVLLRHEIMLCLKRATLCRRKVRNDLL